MSFVLVLRPHRDAMPTDPTPDEALVGGDPAVTSGIMRPELRPLRISIR